MSDDERESLRRDMGYDDKHCRLARELDIAIATITRLRAERDRLREVLRLMA